ncbi:MAG: 2-dehydropantoate 2-reductase [Deltaproteobacteria bacterium]
MRVAVLGAGAIGCWVGGRLAAGGVDVTLIGRPRVIDELRDGLTVTELGDKSWTSKPALATEPSTARDADVVLVTVKSAATAAAGAELAEIQSEAIIVSLQNGVHNAEVLRAALPGRIVLAGMVGYNVAWVGPGRYHRGTSGEILVEAHPAVEPFLIAAKRAELALEARADMPAVQWGKLVMNLNNAINALSGKPLFEELSDRDFRRCLAAAQREALDVLAMAKQPVAKLLALPPRWVARILPMPDWAFRRIATRVASVDPQARSSMQDDFRHGRATEIDFLQGEIVAVAHQYGRASPINAKLVELVRSAEAGGKRDFTGAELWAQLRAT